MMDRTERTGVGISIAGHVLLFAALSVGLFAASKPIVPQNQPMDIQIVDKVGLTETVPNPSKTPPAARVTPEVGTPEEAASEPEPTPTPDPAPTPPTPAPEPVAPPRPVIKPTPVKPTPTKPAPTKPAPTKPAPTKPTPAKPAPAKPAPAKPTPAKPAPAKPARSKPAAKPSAAKPTAAKPAKSTTAKAPSTAATTGRRPGLSRSLIAGLTDAPGVSSAQPSKSTSTTPRAAAGPAVEASLAREVLRQLKPFWRSPTGADAELLRTQLSISLARDGSVVAVRAIGTTGVTDSNRGQVRLHQEAAIKAVKLAAPFSLPAEFFDAWKLLEPVSFDRKLSQ